MQNDAFRGNCHQRLDAGEFGVQWVDDAWFYVGATGGGVTVTHYSER